MTEQEVLKILNSVNAVMEGHFVYTSGLHGNFYVNKDAVYPHTHLISKLCEELAYRFKDHNVDVVIGPAMGGIILSQRVAEHMSKMTGKNVLSVFAEPIPVVSGKAFGIKRGQDKFILNRNVLVVEDILNTGISACAVVDTTRAFGGKVVGVGAICNRGGVTTSDLGDVPLLHSLINISLKTEDEKGCSLCARGVPINTDVGKGREFLARKSQT